MSHTIASVSQATYLPKEQGPGISAVQSQPSFGFEQEDASNARPRTFSNKSPSLALPSTPLRQIPSTDCSWRSSDFLGSY